MRSGSGATGLFASAGRAGSSAAARMIDGALSGPLPEEIARSLIDHGVAERVVRAILADADLEATLRRIARDPEFEATLRRIARDPELERLLIEAVESAEAQRLLETVAASPAVRKALARQSVTFASEVGESARTSATALDDAVERAARRAVRRPPTRETHAYGGIATRAAALSLDLAAALAGFAVLGAILGLVASLVGHLRPAWLAGALVGGGWLLLAGAYLGFFWTVAGQTPGMRVMRLRVVDPAGNPPSAGRSLLRLVGLLLSIAPCFAGFVPILFSDRRRGLQDYVAGTTVLREPSPS
jgi:uncharacterized RDD family membrane protein YckC